MTEVSVICSANLLTGFYRIGSSVMKVKRIILGGRNFKIFARKNVRKQEISENFARKIFATNHFSKVIIAAVRLSEL